MLVLTRKSGEGIVIGDDVVIKIIEIKGGSIRIGIDAPSEKKIYRQEIFDKISLENKEAAQWTMTDLEAFSDNLTPVKKKEMRKLQTRFGEVEYDENNLLHFPVGMIGLPTLHHFIVIPNKKKGPLFWIQSVDDPEIAFVLTDPTNFFLEYKVIPDDSEKMLLHLEEEDPCYVLSVVTVPPDQNITVNLAAPIMFNPKSNRAIQVILEKSEYSSKTPLPK